MFEIIIDLSSLEKCLTISLPLPLSVSVNLDEKMASTTHIYHQLLQNI